MNYVEIYVDGYLIDLGDQEIIMPITYELIDIKNLNNRSGSKTKTITIPRTKKNDKIFGHAYDMSGTNQFSKYTYREIRIEENSFPIFIGLLQLTEVTKSTISFFCFSELSKFKGISGTKVLADLNLKDLNHVYDESVFGTWNGDYPTDVPEDYFYPLIDYGQFKDRTPGSAEEPPETDIFITDVYPALYLERAIRQICIDNGYSLVSSFFENLFISRMLLPFVNEEFVHDRNYGIETDGFWGENTTPYEILDATTGVENLSVPTEIYDALNQWDTGTNEYTANALQTILYSFEFTFTITNSVSNLPAYYITEHWDDIAMVWTEIERIPMEAPTFPISIINPTGSIILQTNDKLRFRVEKNEDCDIIVESILQFIIDPSDADRNINVGEIVQMAPNLPNIKQIDLFKWCYQMFDWVIFINDSQGVIYIETVDAYYGNNDFKDYSNKLNLNIEPIISYQSTDFKRKYDFQYTHDQFDYWLSVYDGKNSTTSPALFGDGQLYLTNEGEATLIGKVGFSPTVIEQTFTGTIGDYVELPSIQKIGSRGEKTTKTTPRILIYPGNVDVDIIGTVSNLSVENVGNVSQVPLCYFQKKKYYTDIDQFKLNLSFQTPAGASLWTTGNLIDEYYRKTIENLSVSAQLTAYFNLNETDINSLDFSVLWYIEEYNSFFRLNRIIDYQPGRLKSTKVELIKKAILTDIDINDFAEIT